MNQLKLSFDRPRKVLQRPLRHKWFDQAEEGIKHTEYFKVSPWWIKQFGLVALKEPYWRNFYYDEAEAISPIGGLINYAIVAFDFDFILLQRAYDTNRAELLRKIVSVNMQIIAHQEWKYEPTEVIAVKYEPFNTPRQ